MFTDTPKLQPISTSKKKDKNVPSNNGNQYSSNNNNNNNASVNNIASKSTNASYTNKDPSSNRSNHGSYRSNNYQNQAYSKNYKPYEFNEYSRNGHKNSNRYDSHKRWNDWTNSPYNKNYNRWNSNHNNNNNNNYRNNYKYPENTYRECNSTFAEDSFQFDSFNNESSKNTENDQVKDTTNTRLPSSKKNYTNKTQYSNIRKNGSRPNRGCTKSNYSSSKKNSKNSKSSTQIRIEEKKAEEKQLESSLTTCIEKEFSQTLSIPDSKNAIEKTIEEVNSRTRKLLNEINNELDKDIETINSKFIHLKENNLESTNFGDTASNADVHVENQTEIILNSRGEDTFNATNSTALAAIDSQINSSLTTEEINEKPEEPKQPTSTGTPTIFHDTTTATYFPLNTSITNKSENRNSHVPKISLIPITRLISSEFCKQTCSDNSMVVNSPKHLNTQQKITYKPNLIKRKRNASTCSNSSTSSQTNSPSDRIVEKLVAMSKIDIKNIINSSDTMYDEALKAQARKRLREEIRRQLKSMNIEPPKDPVSTNFVPDEIVDSIDIPDVVFDEIRKALGLELFPFYQDNKVKCVEEILESDGSKDTTKTIPSSENSATVTTALETNELQQHSMNPILPSSPPPPPSTPTKVKNELITERISVIKNSEKKRTKTPENRKKSKKLTKRKETRKSKKRRASPKKLDDEVVVLISSSSSSESSSTSSSTSSSSSSSSSSYSSSSDSESDVSEKSSTSSAKRKRLKLKVDAENVVDSFEKLILPSLSENLRERYRSKYSNSVNTKLHFVSCICTSDYNSGKFSKLQVAKIQKNLKSSDCSMALEFLMKEIVNVFNKQKQMAKMDDNNKATRKLESSPKSESTKDASKKPNAENVIKRNTSNGKKSSSKSSCPLSDNIKTNSVNAAEKIKLSAPTTSENQIQQCVSKVLSLYRQEMKTAMQANEMKNQSFSATHNSQTTAENEAEKPQSPSSSLSSSKNLDKNAGHAKQNEDENEAHLNNPINCNNQQQQHQQQHQTAQQQQEECVAINRKAEENQHKAQPPRNDTIEGNVLTAQIIPIHNFCSTDYSNNVSNTLNANLNSTLLGISSASCNQQPPFPIVDLEELKKQSPIGDVVVKNLREIDLKLMELHKRKMYLEEMILKLQNNKMEADLLTIKLQNEKFILLNTAMTANVTSTAMQNHNNNNKNNESFSSLKNIKLETTTTTTTTSNSKDKPNIVLEDKEVSGTQETQNPKSPTSKNRSAAATKRKQSPSSATNEISKKRCKSSKQTTRSTIRGSSKKICSERSTSNQKKTCSERSTSDQKTTTEITAKTSSKCAASDNLTSSTTENVSKDATENHTTPPTIPAETLAAPEPPASSQVQPTTKEVNNNPEVDDKTKSLYKKMPTGSFEGIRNPITQIRIFEDFIVASSEDGKLYKFDVTSLKLLTQFAKHTEAITQMNLCPERKIIYTTSLDGYLKKSSLENFALDVQSIYLQEPLQSIDIQWDNAYIGSRWGNIYTYNTATNYLADKPLCSTDSSIISIKAVKEGVRKTLIVSSKGNLIHLRDATSGLLLRTFDVPESINIYSILLNDGIIYCGTQKKEIRKYDFASGQYLGFMTCGNGAVSMQMYNNTHIFVGCYDGFIYILDKIMGKQIGRLAGSGKMILTLEIIENKIITSAKDNTMKVTDIPSYCFKNNTHIN